MTSDLQPGGSSTLDADAAPKRSHRALVRTLEPWAEPRSRRSGCGRCSSRPRIRSTRSTTTHGRQRAEQICVAADTERLQLADFREMREATPELVRERAEIVDGATDILERMLDDVVAVEPTSVKGRDLIPQWATEYRSYLDSRRVFADTLRDHRRQQRLLRAGGGRDPGQRTARGVRRRQRHGDVRPAARPHPLISRSA